MLHRLARPLCFATAVLLGAVVLAGCAHHDGAAAGVEPTATGVAVRFKPCDTDQGVQRLRVLDPSDHVVWSATTTSRETARTSIVISSIVTGYAVDDRLGPQGLRGGTTYRTVADGTNGQTWTGPTFDPADLHAGEVLAAGKRVDDAAWAAAEASCTGRSPAAVAGGALLAGVAAAVVIGVLLGPLWLLRRSALRRAREREGHLPWLHDPPPGPAPVRWWPTRWRRRPPNP